MWIIESFRCHCAPPRRLRCQLRVRGVPSRAARALVDMLVERRRRVGAAGAVGQGPPGGRASASKAADPKIPPQDAIGTLTALAFPGLLLIALFARRSRASLSKPANFF